MINSTDIKEILDIQQVAYRDATNMLFASLSQRIDDQNKLIFDLKYSLEFSQDEIKLMEKEATEYRKKFDDQSKLINDLTIKLREQQLRISKQEDHTRKRNIRIDGVEDGPNENWEQTTKKVEQILTDKMKISNIKIDYAHRIKKAENKNGPRTIIARLRHEGDKQNAMKNSHKLKGTNIFINEDFSEETVKKRIQQLPKLKEARKDGKIAYFVGDRLVIRNRSTENHAPGITSATPPRQNISTMHVSSLREKFTPNRNNDQDGGIDVNENTDDSMPSVQSRLRARTGSVSYK